MNSEFPFNRPCQISNQDCLGVRRSVLRVTRAHDADEHAQNLSQWDQRYDQLSAGNFEGCVTELWLPHTQVFVERANRQLRQTCAAWPQSVWFGIPAAEDGQMSMGSKRLSADAVCIRDGGAEFDLMTAPDFDLYGIVVNRAAFSEYVEANARQDLERLLRQRDVVALAPLHKASLCAALATVLSDASQLGEENPQALQSRIFELMMRVLQQGQGGGVPVRRSQLTRQQTVERIREYLLQDPTQPPSIPDLCERLHISRRALQNCVEEVTGLSPLAYMRNIRLNAVRRELCQGSNAQPISNIAYAWGFSHLSQFAHDYRQLFGELPSESRHQHEN
jgi:AraC family transcriptional regulator, ethanolamine operon transcriptional activator